MPQFENLIAITPKAFANFSPGLECNDNPGYPIQIHALTLKGLGGWRTLTGFINCLGCAPRVVVALQPWAEISQRLRRSCLQISN